MEEKRETFHLIKIKKKLKKNFITSRTFKFIKIFIVIVFLIYYIIFYNYFFNLNNKKSILFKFQNKKEKYFTKIFLNEINKIFNETHHVNMNEVENKITGNIYNINKTNINSVINIGFTLDQKYILQTMLTSASIMSTQDKTTKIIFHFGVINEFTAENMIKIYELKKKLNNLTEINFYYLIGAMTKMKNFHPKGEACPGKFELPQLLPDYVKRLIIFDAGDVLILRDLTEL